MTATIQTPDTNQPEAIVEVTDMDQMVRILIKWNEEKVAVLRHMIDIPEHSQVEIQNDNPLVLSGDVRRAFQLGIQMSLEELGNLPFTVDHSEQSH